MENNIIYSYDEEFDAVTIQMIEDYDYKESIVLDFGVYLDIDVNYNPVCLEIIDASKILGVNEKMLVNPRIKMDIDIKNDLIKICATFYFEDCESVYSKNIANNFNIPEMNTILV